LFWRRSTQWGALAATLFVAASLIGTGLLQGTPAPPRAAAAKPTTNTVASAAALTNAAPKSAATNALAAKPAAAGPAAGKPKEDIIWQIGQGAEAVKILSRAPNGDVRFLNGYMTVFPMVVGSALCMIVFSLLTKPPSKTTIDKYFSVSSESAGQNVH
jgi:predicted lipid-binding transport protein (Tim44 family)